MDKTKFTTWEWEYLIEILEQTIDLLEKYEEEIKGEFKELMINQFKIAWKEAKTSLLQEQEYWRKFNYFLAIVKQSLEKYIEEKNKHKQKW